MNDADRDLLTGRYVRVAADPPEHDASLLCPSPHDARQVVDRWAQHIIELGGRDDVAYVLACENRGSEVGADKSNPHGQIHAYGFVPPAAQRELENVACALCEPAPDGLDVDRARDWHCFVPALATWPYELIVAPRDHIADLPTLDGSNRDALAELLPRAIGRLDAHFGAETPLTMWVHQRPYDGNDWPQAHVHVHVAPRWRGRGVPHFLGAAELGSDVYFNPVSPMQAAAELRAAAPR